MKKTLVSALTTALVVGAASTTFAAANPFSDVPADHWAYDAVAQLASEGVVNGYTDSSFQGDTTMTRYEMAQIVAKAMAKQDAVNAQQKAMLDKLAAEFSDELANLGVRVAALEAKTDNVKWAGYIRYYAQRNNEEKTGQPDGTNSNMRLELNPIISLNDHWTGYTRLRADSNTSTNNSANVKMKRVWVTGKYDNFTISFGKLPVADEVSDGLLYDTDVSGAEATYQAGDWKIRLAGGRENVVSVDEDGNKVMKKFLKAANATDETSNVASNFMRAELMYAQGKLNAGMGFHKVTGVSSEDVKWSNMNIYNVGAKYAFDDNIALGAGYAKASVDASEKTTGADLDFVGSAKTSYNVQLAYKGADSKKAGSYGLVAGYHQLGLPSTSATWDTSIVGTRGWFVNGEVTLTKNVMAFAELFSGKYLGDNAHKVNSIYGKVTFMF